VKAISSISIIFSMILLFSSIASAIPVDPNSKPTHNIAITKVTVPSSCSEGDTVPVTLSVANKGNYRETFRVTLTDTKSGKEIAGKEVTLAEGWKDGSDDVAGLIFDAEGDGPDDFGNYLCASDVNGDGYEDLFFSVQVYGNMRGRVYIYYGGPDFDNIPDVKLTGENVGDRFGESLCTGDFNYDSYQDIVVGACFYHSHQGRVYVYYGGADIDDVADVIVENPDKDPSSIFGRVVASGDVNGDSFSDLVVVAVRYDNDRGKAYLYYGGESLDTSVDETFEGEKQGDKYGRRTAIGDVDGDDCDDILFGTRDFDKGNKQKIGRAYLHFGSGVALCDIDADGCCEILIGARYWNKWQGKISIWWGGTRDIDQDNADVHLYGDARTNSHLASDTITCGYFNDDEYLDVFSGGFGTGGGQYPGCAFIFYGGGKSSMDSQWDKRFYGEDKKGLYGMETLPIDINGDGYDDAVVSDIWYDNKRGRVYLYWGSPGDSTQLKFDWDTTNASPGKHILKATIAPVAGEEDTVDNALTATVNIKAP